MKGELFQWVSLSANRQRLSVNQETLHGTYHGRMGKHRENRGESHLFSEISDPIADWMSQATPDEVVRLQAFLNGPARKNLTRYFWRVQSTSLKDIKEFEDSFRSSFSESGLPQDEEFIKTAMDEARQKYMFREAKKLMLEDFLKGGIDLGPMS